MPPLGFSPDPDDLDATHRTAPALRQSGPQHTLISQEPQRGHDGATLAVLITIFASGSGKSAGFH